MEVAQQIWDQFTAGNAVERAQKIKEEEELEEKLKQEALAKQKKDAQRFKER